MTVSIKKWGNSLALRIPKDVAQTLSIENDSVMELHIERGTLVIEPKREVTLESMITKIDKNNLHGEVDTTQRMGNEEW